MKYLVNDKWVHEYSTGEGWDPVTKELALDLGEARTALRRYGGHTATCDYHLNHYKGPVHQCTCGWTDLADKVHGVKTEKVFDYFQGDADRHWYYVEHGTSALEAKGPFMTKACAIQHSKDGTFRVID